MGTTALASQVDGSSTVHRAWPPPPRSSTKSEVEPSFLNVAKCPWAKFGSTTSSMRNGPRGSICRRGSRSPNRHRRRCPAAVRPWCRGTGWSRGTSASRAHGCPSPGDTPRTPHRLLLVRLVRNGGPRDRSRVLKAGKSLLRHSTSEGVSGGPGQVRISPPSRSFGTVGPRRDGGTGMNRDGVRYPTLNGRSLFGLRSAKVTV